MATILDGMKGGKHNSDNIIATGKKSKTKYFDIHVNLGDGEGYSVFLRMSELFADGWNDDQKIAHAVKTGKLNAGDAKSVDYVRETTKKDYEKANKA